MVNSPIKAEDLATEFSVVRNEFEMGENSPQRVLSQRMMAVAYEWHNYGKSTIGNRSDIERVPVDNLRAFYKRFYQPDNAMLVVAGKFDEKKALEYITKYFGSLAQARPQAPRDLHRRASAGRRASRHAAAGGRRRLGRTALSRPGGLACRVPRGADPGRHPRFTSRRGGSTRHWSSPRRPPAYQSAHRRRTTRARSRSSPRSTPKTWRPSKRSATSCSAFSTKWPGRASPSEEVEPRPRSRSSRTASWLPPIPIASPFELSEWAAQGDWRLYFLNRDRIEQVTPAQVKEVAEKYFTTSNRTVGFFVPTAKPERTPIPAVPDIAKLVEGYTGRQVKAARARPPTSRPGHRGPAAAARADRRRQAGASCPRRPGASPSSCG